MMARAVGAKKLDELKQPKPEWVKLLHEFSPITHVSAGDPPVLIQNPRVDPLPATSAGSAIHHAIFGVKLKEKADAAGVDLHPAPPGSAGRDAEPEAFLIEHLTARNDKPVCLTTALPFVESGSGSGAAGSTNWKCACCAD